MSAPEPPQVSDFVAGVAAAGLIFCTFVAAIPWAWGMTWLALNIWRLMPPL